MTQQRTITLLAHTTTFGPTQKRFLEDQSPRLLLSGGYGSGKTFIGAEKALDEACKVNPGVDGLIVSPTWQMLTRTTRLAFMKALPREFIRRERLSDRCVELKNGSRIWFASADKPGSLEGTNVGWVWIDEARLMKRAAYEVVVGRARLKSAPKPKVFLTTTPTMDWLYDEFGKSSRAGHRMMTAPTSENAHNLAPGFIEMLRATYSKRMAEALIEGRFVVTTAAVFESFDEQRHVVDFVPQGHHDTVLMLDFGVRSPSVICAQVLAHDVWISPTCTLPAGAIVIVDEVHPDGTPTVRLHQHTRSRPLMVSARTVYMDPAGKARDQHSGETGVDVIRDTFGIQPRWSTDPAERDVANGVALLQQALDPIDGQPMLYVARDVFDRAEADERKPRRDVIAMLRGLRYPERDGRVSSDAPFKDGILDHCADALRYGVVGILRDRRRIPTEMLRRTLYGHAA